MPIAYLPSPSFNGFHIGPLFVHVYGLMLVLAVTAAVLITGRRWWPTAARGSWSTTWRYGPSPPG